MSSQILQYVTCVYLESWDGNAAVLSIPFLLWDTFILKAWTFPLKCGSIPHKFSLDFTAPRHLTQLVALMLILTEMVFCNCVPSSFKIMKMIFWSTVAIAPRHFTILRAPILMASMLVMVSLLKRIDTLVCAARERAWHGAHVHARTTLVFTPMPCM